MAGHFTFAHARRLGRHVLLPFLLLLIALLLPRPALALDPGRALTQYLHRIWQVQQGLPQSTIYAIRQSADGYLWLGTQSGLYRFDGVRFTPTDPSSALQDAWVRDLCPAPDQSLWVATNDAGLFRIKGAQVTQFTRDSGLPSNCVYRLFADHSGRLWACTSDGLASISPATGGSLQPGTILQMQQGLASNDVRAAAADSANHLWVAANTDAANSLTTPGGPRLQIWDGQSFHDRILTTLPPSTIIRDIYCAPDDTVWVATRAGLVELRGNTEKRYTTADGLAGDDIYRITPGADGTLWLGTQDGFSRLRANHFESYQARDGLSQSTVFSLCEDREGSLWIGTKHGLNQFLDGRTIPFTTNEGLPSNDTGPILQDRSGQIWVGTFGAGLSRFDGQDFHTLSTHDGLASDTILALAADSTNGLWIGTDKGANHFTAGRLEPTPTDGLPTRDIRCLFIDQKGNLWAGTSHGPAMLSNDKWIAPNPAGAGAGETEDLRSPVVALGEIPDGVLAALDASGGGDVLIIRGGIAREFTPEGDSLRDVACFYRDPDGLLWIGMRGGGLALYDGHRVQDFSVQQGLFDDDIRCITADNQNRLWMACSKGIFSVNRADLARIVAGSQSKVVSLPFSPTEGLRTIECTAGVSPAACTLTDGRIWFSSIRGAVVLDPAKLQRNLPPLPVLVEQVLVDGKPLPPQSTERLAPGSKNVEFRYTALSFVQPARLTFRYRLEGFDKDWIDAGTRREAIYTNLPPGTFRFLVAAADPPVVPQAQSAITPIVWSQAPAPVWVTIEPQFYQQLWFIPVCLAAITLVVILAFRLRVRAVRHRMDAIVAERGRIARELHDTLIQGFSGVTMQLQALLQRLRHRAPTISDPSEPNDLEEIIRDAATCLREARRSIAGLRETSQPHTRFGDVLRDAVRQQLTGTALFARMHLDTCPQSLPAPVEFALLRILQEALTNITRHAHARNIDVQVVSADDSVRLEIRDDGRGFDPASLPRDNGHFGIVGMRERAAEIGASLQLESSPNHGTLVRIIVPLKHEPASPALVAAKVVAETARGIPS